jgi:hypothetical protein
VFDIKDLFGIFVMVEFRKAKLLEKEVDNL